MAILPQDSTIFVVDDDEAVRDSLCALLEAYLFRVEGFAATQAFLDAVDGDLRPPERSCLVLDLHLPRSGGLALLQSLAARGMALPVIVVTGSLDAQTKAQVLAAGALAAIENRPWRCFPTSDRSSMDGRRPLTAR